MSSFAVTLTGASQGLPAEIQQYLAVFSHLFTSVLYTNSHLMNLESRRNS